MPDAEFHLFPELPLEIRLQIWRTTLYVPLLHGIAFFGMEIFSPHVTNRLKGSTAASRKILSVCHESRREGLVVLPDTIELTRTTKHPGGTIHFNAKTDVLCLEDLGWAMQMIRHGGSVPRLLRSPEARGANWRLPEWAKRVERLGMEIGDSDWQAYNYVPMRANGSSICQFPQLVTLFPRLKQFYLISKPASEFALASDTINPRSLVVPEFPPVGAMLHAQMEPVLTLPTLPAISSSETEPDVEADEQPEDSEVWQAFHGSEPEKGAHYLAGHRVGSWLWQPNLDEQRWGEHVYRMICWQADSAAHFLNPHPRLELTESETARSRGIKVQVMLDFA